VRQIKDAIELWLIAFSLFNMYADNDGGLDVYPVFGLLCKISFNIALDQRRTLKRYWFYGMCHGN